MSTAESTMIGRLKLIRKELGLTQREFASNAGLSYSLYIQMESGAKSITERTVNLICKAYSVNDEWLQHGNGAMFVDSRQKLFEQFTAAFNLSTAQQRQVAEIIQFPLDRINVAHNSNLATAKRNVARLVKAIDRGSVGRVDQGIAAL